MSYWHVDASASGLGTGLDWTDAYTGVQALDVGETIAAGDVILCRASATKDVSTSNFNWALPESPHNPVQIIGVKSGTTNEGSSVVVGDLCSRSAGDEYIIDATTYQFEPGGGSVIWHGIKVETDTVQVAGSISRGSGHLFNDVTIEMGADWLPRNAHAVPWVYINCKIEALLSGDDYELDGDHIFYGGEWVKTTGGISRRDAGTMTGFGMDLTGMATIWQANSYFVAGNNTLKYCLMQASFTPVVNFDVNESLILGAEFIGCSSQVAAKTDAETFQDYYFENLFGAIANTTFERDGGADDKASGVFSISMELNANVGSEKTLLAGLQSPMISGWVDADGTSKTAEVFIANDGGVDYNVDEVHCLLFVPSATTANGSMYDMVRYPSIGPMLFGSTTKIDDDTVSVWDGGAAGSSNAQKFVHTWTPEHSGPVFGWIWLNKQQATPDTLYLDPAIWTA